MTWSAYSTGESDSHSLIGGGRSIIQYVTGSLYLMDKVAPVISSNIRQDINVWESTDGGITWTKRDFARMTLLGAKTLVGQLVEDDSNDIQIFTMQRDLTGTGVDEIDAMFFIFDPGTEAFTEEETEPWASGNFGSLNIGAGIEVRSSGDRVVFGGAVIKYMGTDYWNAKAAEYVSSWTEIAISPGSVTYNERPGGMVEGASGKMHFFYRNDNDGNLYHKSLADGSTTPSSAESCGAVTTFGQTDNAPHNASYYDDSGTEVIYFTYDDYLYEVRADGTPETRFQFTTDTVLDQCSFLLEDHSGNLVIWYVVDNGGNDYDYKHVVSDDAGASWDDPVIFQNAGNNGAMDMHSALFYTQTGTALIGFHVDDATDRASFDYFEWSYTPPTGTATALVDVLMRGIIPVAR